MPLTLNLHGLVLLGRLRLRNPVDLRVVLIQFFELDRIGVILVDEFKPTANLLFGDVIGGGGDLADEEGELCEGEAALLLIEIVEDLPQRECVSVDDPVQLLEAALDLATGLG
jgi:hypothetical protein